MFGKIFNVKAYNFKYYNISVLFTVFILSFIGLTVIEVLQDPADKLYERQIFGLAVGIIAALVVSLIDYHFICKFYILLYLVNMALLVATKLFGKSYHDAQRWLVIPKINLQVQPSEFSKILLILFLATLLNKYRKKIDKIYFLAIACILIAVPLLFILEQPDLSTTIALLLVFASMIFLSGLTYKIIIPLIIIVIPACAGLWWYIQQDFQMLLKPYQQKRILALKNPELYPDLMWQQENAAKAIKAGGLTGKFMTEGTDASMLCQKLPAIESDFIFTAISEAYGFIGGCVVVALLAFFVIRAFRIASRASDYLGMLIAGGIGSMIAVQTVINVCVNTSLFPNTGIPLPFISSGLSSLLGNYIMVGVLMNVSLQARNKKKELDN